MEDASGNTEVAEDANYEVVVLAGTAGEFFGQAMSARETYVIAGNGTGGYSGNGVLGTSAELDGPAGVAVDTNGNVVIGDSFNCIVRVVAASTGSFYGTAMTAGYIYTIAGTASMCGSSGDGGPATSAELNEPAGVAVDRNGNVIIADEFHNHRIQLVAEQSCSSGCPYGLAGMTVGDIYTIAGNGTAGYSGNGVLGTTAEVQLEGVGIDADGNVVVADQSNQVIRILAAASCASSCPYGLPGLTSGFIYTIAGSPGVAGYSGDGGAATSAELGNPYATATDSNGNILIADTSNSVIRVIAVSSSNPGYALESDCGGGTSSCSWAAGDIYTIAGDGTAGYSGDGGPAVLAELHRPLSVATNGFGQVLVSDTSNGALRVFAGAPITPQSVLPQGSAIGSDEWGGNGCPCATSHPVNLATGDYYDSVSDLSIPGTGIPLQFTRTYDAFAAQSEAATAGTAPELGYGWATNLGMSATLTSGVATVTLASGAELTFQTYAMGASEPAWCPSDAAAAVFCPTAPRFIASLTESGSVFTYTDRSGSPMAYVFGGTGGALSEIEDANGDTLTAAAYVAGTGEPLCASGDTCVAWTSIPAGMSSGQSLVVETKNSNGHLASVFDPAATNQTVSFTYTGTGCSTWSGGRPTAVCSATDPGSLTTTYTYTSSNPTAKYDYDESTMSPPNTGEVSNTYTAGDVTEQTITVGATTQETDFAYATDSALSGGTETTETTYPLGPGTGNPKDKTLYQFSNDVLSAETTGYSSANAATTYFDRDPATLLPTVVIDGDGNVSSQSLDDYASPGGDEATSEDPLTSTDGAHNTSQTAYTAANLVWCSVEAADHLDTSCPSSEPSSPPAPGVTDPYPGVAQSFYNSANELTATTDALGNTTTYSYTSSVSGIPNGLMYCSIDPVDYQKLSGGLPAVVCPAYGATHVMGTSTSTFDSTGDVTSTTDADGNTTTFTYGVPGLPGLVASETDPDGDVTSYAYNNMGEVLEKQVCFPSSCTGYVATTIDSYDSTGHQICEIDPYEYAQGVTTCPSTPPTPPTPTSDSWLGRTITTYDADGRVTQVTNPVGGITYTAYDLAGEVYCTVGPLESASPTDTTCPALPITTPTASTDLYPGATITTYDSDGRVVQVTNPAGGITKTTYDGAGNVASTTVKATSSQSTDDPDLVTSYVYDSDNRVTTTYVGSGSDVSSSTVEYDPDGNVFCSAPANAELTTSSWACPAWQASWASEPPRPDALYPSVANNVTTTFYNADGQELQSTDPDVHTTVSAYDANDNETCAVDPTNEDAWLSAHTSGTGSAYPYNCPEPPITIAPSPGSDPGYTTTIYDDAGRTSSVTDQLGDTTSYTYDPSGNVLTTVNPQGDTTTDCYYWEDTTGACAASAPSGGGPPDELYSTTTPATSADPSGETTAYTYFPGDQTETSRTPAGTTTYAYDGLGDVTSDTYSSTASGYSTPANVSYSYFPDGSREQMTDGIGTTAYTYDSLSQQASQTLTPVAGSSLTGSTISYGYFATGALESVVYPSYGSYTNPTATYEYDVQGNVDDVSDWLGNDVKFTTDGDGNETAQKNRASGTVTSQTTFAYDAADEQTSGSRPAEWCISSLRQSLPQRKSSSWLLHSVSVRYQA